MRKFPKDPVGTVDSRTGTGRKTSEKPQRHDTDSELKKSISLHGAYMIFIVQVISRCGSERPAHCKDG